METKRISASEPAGPFAGPRMPPWRERHQRLDHQPLIQAPPLAIPDTVQRRERIGGLLSSYHREAA